MVVTAVVILVVAVVAVGALFVVGFNKLRSADVSAQEALGGIDVQLTRRADLIPNLVTTVKGYAAHEKSVLEAVTAARTSVSKATASGTVGEKAAADALQAAQPEIYRGVAKGVLHKNTASRKYSRLTKRVAAL